MNKRRFKEEDYINFLVAAQKSYSCKEAEKVQPFKKNAANHDSINRLLHRTNPTTERLWEESSPQINKKTGLLILDDSTLDKPYSKQIELVSNHWSGKHKRTVKGINLLSILWTNGDKNIPLDFRLYDKPNDNKSKNDHFKDLVERAYSRGLQPEYTCFDSWYGSVSNLKLINRLDWLWLTCLKKNRLVNPDKKGNVNISDVDIPKEGRVIHLKAYGMIKVFKMVSKNGRIKYWASNDLNMNELKRLSVAEKTWGIENYHRGLKQFCGVEKSQVRSATAQHNHISFSIRAFLRFEVYFYKTGHSWFEAKMLIIRHAIRDYISNPCYLL